MNQQIGITYSVKGADQVVASFERMGKGINDFLSHMSSVDRLMARFERATDVLTSRMRGVRRAFDQFSTGRMTRGLDEGTNSVTRLNTSLQRTAQLARSAAAELRHASTMPAMGGGRGPGGVVPVGPGEPSGRGGRRAGEGREAPMWMLRWWTYYRGMQAGRELFTDVGLAGAREPLLPSLRDLSAIGLNTEQRRQAELQGQKFVSQWPAAGKIQDYLQALAEVGSAKDVNSPEFKGRGVQELGKIAGGALRLGAVSQMSPQASTKSLMAATHAQIFQMSKREQGQYQTGEKSFAGLAESTGSKIAQIIKTSSIWGTDVQHFINYALPTALSKGWSMDTILGLAGSMRTAGYQGQKAGRGLRGILEAESGKLGALFLAGDEDPRKWEQYKKLSGRQQKDLKAELIPHINQQLAADPISFFGTIGRFLQRAEARGIDPVQSLQFSRENIPYLRMMGKPGFTERWRAETEGVKRANTLDQSRGYLRDVQQDPGYALTRLRNEWDMTMQSFGRNGYLQNQMEGLTYIMREIREWNNRGGKIDYQSVLGELKDFGLHGIAPAIVDTVNGLTTAIYQKLGLLGQDYKAPSFEEQIASLNKIPERIYSTVSEMVGNASRMAEDAVSQALSWVDAKGRSWAERQKQEMSDMVPRALRPETYHRESITPVPQADQVIPNNSPNLPQQIMPYYGQPSSYEGGSSSLGTAITQLVAVLGSQQGGGQAPNIRVMIGDREIHDVVHEAIAERDMANRNQWGHWGA